MQLEQRLYEIAPNSAAHAPRGQQHGVLLHRFDERIVQAHLTELIDDHRRASSDLRMLEERLEQRRLA